MDVYNVWKLQLYSRVHDWQRRRLREEIPALKGVATDHIVSLYRYLAAMPHRLYSRLAYDLYLSFLAERHRLSHPHSKPTSATTSPTSTMLSPAWKW